MKLTGKVIGLLLDMLSLQCLWRWRIPGNSLTNMSGVRSRDLNWKNRLGAIIR